MGQYQDFKVGDRVELVRTTDPYTKLAPGDQGTIARIRIDLTNVGTAISIRWDSGSSLTMFPDLGDKLRQL